MENENQLINLTHHVPEFPGTPTIEVSRDSLATSLHQRFNRDNQKLIIVSNQNTGKTNFLSQFCRIYSDSAVSYFFNTNPITYDLKNFLYVIINQVYKILELEDLPLNIPIDTLRSLIIPCVSKLSDISKKNNKKYIFVIDGIDNLLIHNQRELVDFFLPSLPLSPFTLYSCRPENLSKIPSEILNRFKVEESLNFALLFNSNDTNQFLSDLEISSEIINAIQKKCRGNPGYLTILKKAILIHGYEWLSTGEIPDDIDSFIKNQINQLTELLKPEYMRLLYLVSAINIPIDLNALLGYSGFKANEIEENLIINGLLTLNIKNNLCQVQPDIFREMLVKDYGKKKDALIKDFLLFYEKYGNKNTNTCLHLLNEVNDYEGIKKIVNTNSLIENLKTKEEIYPSLSALKFGLNKSIEIKKLDDVINYCVSLHSIDTVINQTLAKDEIYALISIEKYQEAIKKAYKIQDTFIRIRLLARAYYSIKENGGVISNDAINELRFLIENISFENMDKELIQEFALDIFPILPDQAASILEKIFGDSEKRGAIDIALAAATITSNEKPTDTVLSKIESTEIKMFSKLFSTWLKNLPIRDLISEVKEINNTSAKEFFIRNWCRQNRNCENIHDGIDFWLETTLADSNFIISLNSLRQISSLLINVNKENKLQLIKKFEISSILQLRSPWEEWISFQLNLAEELFQFNQKEAENRIENIYETINTDIDSKDLKVFCYARLLKSVLKLNLKLEEEICSNYRRVLRELLDNTAMQDEILNNTLILLSTFHIDLAIETANQLNTKSRRENSLKLVIRRGFIRSCESDVTSIISPQLFNLDKLSQQYVILQITRDLCLRERSINYQNQKFLLDQSRRIEDNALKGEALCNLSFIWKNEKIISRGKLLNEAYESWRKEPDLNSKINIGYGMVERTSHFDKVFSTKLCEEIQRIQLNPGAQLALGNMGLNYKDLLSLSIRLLEKKNFYDSQILDSVKSQIEQIQSIPIRISLYTQLAAKAYELDSVANAEMIIQKQILPMLNFLKSSFDKEYALSIIFPIIVFFDENQVLDLCKSTAKSNIEIGYYKAIFWIIGKYNPLDIPKIEKSGLEGDHKSLLRSVGLVKNINTDGIIFDVVIGLTTIIRNSINNRRIDLGQGFGLTKKLEEMIVGKLPDLINIQHGGYKIVIESKIYSLYSFIYSANKRKGGLISNTDIRKKWGELKLNTRHINNISDRVFILTNLARDFASIYKTESYQLLDEALTYINKIPSILDRMDRLEEISKTWGLLGEITKATTVLTTSLDLINSLDDLTRDERLEIIVQAAYEFNQPFAEEIIKKYDTRFPERIINPSKIAYEVKNLMNSPEKISLLNSEKSIFDNSNSVIFQTTSNLYDDLISNRGVVPGEEILISWLSISNKYPQKTRISIYKWVIECISRNYLKNYPHLLMDFINSTMFSNELSKAYSPAMIEGIPETISNQLPGLNSGFTIFKCGENEKAVRYVSEWISKNTNDYLKIIDPYFGIEQFYFLNKIKQSIKVFIITTEEKMDLSDGCENLEKEILLYWRKNCTSQIPNISIMIVPKNCQSEFHDRAIVSKGAGLDIGSSLNSLGNKAFKIRELSDEESKDLEINYVDKMINYSNWIINHNVNPQNIKLFTVSS